MEYQINSLGENEYEINYEDNYNWSSEENVTELQGKDKNNNMDDKSESEDKGMLIISRFEMLKFQYCYFLIQNQENILIGWSG